MGEYDSRAKALRLGRISYWLYRNPRGLTVTELATLCGVTKRTTQRDLQDLETMGLPLWQDGSPPRYGITEGYYLPPVHLSLDDAMALFLAARLLARHTDGLNPHVVEALGKLATILPESIARHVHATIASLASSPSEEQFSRVMAALTVSWASGRKVMIRHQAAASSNAHDYLLSPYFIEPSAAGSSTHVIGHSDYHGGIHTFKIERILSAALTEEPYEIPADFDGPKLLSSAWGIWYGDDAAEVVLRFCASATRRLRETQWHPSQALEDCPDGGVILRLRLAHPEEMVSWIRGWGPQVEVLVPEALRTQLADEARATTALYPRGQHI
ncbi:MAG: helix-turn-helix transcriptional regulator [Anaerolineae bacterium]